MVIYLDDLIRIIITLDVFRTGMIWSAFTVQCIRHTSDKNKKQLIIVETDVDGSLAFITAFLEWLVFLWEWDLPSFSFVVESWVSFNLTNFKQGEHLFDLWWIQSALLIHSELQLHIFQQPMVCWLQSTFASPYTNRSLPFAPGIWRFP